MATGIPADVVRFLRCPHCSEHLKAANGSLGCSRDHTRGHSYDIARQGYVSLFPPDRRRRTPSGDSSKMVAAREQFLAAGDYASLSGAIIATAIEAMRPDFKEGGCVADLGTETADYLARLLEQAMIRLLLKRRAKPL